MKRIIGIAIITFMYSFAIHAQTSGFTVLLEENMHYVVDMIHSTSGNFIIAGTTENQSYVYVTAISKDGEMLWRNYYFGEMLWYASIIQKSDGNFLIPMSNSTAYLLEINQSGDSVGCLTIAEPTKSYFGSIVEMPDSSIFATEIVFNNDPLFPSVDHSFLVKLSPGLGIIEKFNTQFLDVKDLTAGSATELLALVEDGGSDNSTIVKYSTDGQVISTSACTTLNPNLHSIGRLNNNSFAAVGYRMDKRSMQAVLTGFDISNQVLFCNDYSDHYFMSLSTDEYSETIFALGNTDDLCSIKVIDYSGNAISDFTVADSLTGNNIIFIDNYLYLAGVYNYVTAPRSCFIKIHKDSILSINENQYLSRLKVNPNPAGEHIAVDFSQLYTSATLQLMDISGKTVFKTQLTSNRQTIDISALPAGTYLYRISNQKGLEETGKLVVE